ncbi:MAG: hypothetical protein RMN52_00690 [Anaerolineae bacterium]|nr:hypothetical protein [Candidatus Roseilinea sp.]MDW8448493.1 hypothetical protein [Anaerolineae bacterium]
METITLELPERLAAEIRAHKDDLPLILELGLERFARISALRQGMREDMTSESEVSDRFADANFQAAEERFERMFGTVSLGYATGVDNERIDADLAREYGSDHSE